MPTHIVSLAPYVFEAGIKGTGNPVDLAMTGMTLRWAKAHGCYEEAVQYALDRRARRRRWLTLTQRDWQSKVSRRPARGGHHDSWEIRERYVRIGNGGY